MSGKTADTISEFECHGDWIDVSDDHCCVWPFSGWLPTADIDMHVGPNGDSLTIRLIAKHNCGIQAFGMTIRITETATGASWVIRPEATFDCPLKGGADLDTTLSFGVGKPKKLPVNNVVGWRIDVTGWVNSCCGTSKDYKASGILL